MDDASFEAMLARIDERTKTIVEDITNIKSGMSNIRDEMSSRYVSQDAFKALHEKVGAIQRVIFGIAFLVISTVIGAVLKLVIFPGPGPGV